MSPLFTPDDVGKPVETATGDALGTVVSVDDETAYVDPAADVADATSAVLEWGGTAVPLADDAVREVTDDAVRLDASVPEEAIAPGDAADRSGSGESMTADYTPGEPVASNPTDPASDVDAGADPGAGGPDAEPPMRDADEFADAPDGERSTGGGSTPLEASEADSGATATDREEAATDREGMDDVERAASRDLEVDPSELTGGDETAEIEPGEDVGNRTASEADGDRAAPAEESTAGESASADEPPEDAGAIDAAMRTASEQGPEGSDADDAAADAGADEGGTDDRE